MGPHAIQLSLFLFFLFLQNEREEEIKKELTADAALVCFSSFVFDEMKFIEWNQKDKWNGWWMSWFVVFDFCGVMGGGPPHAPQKRENKQTNQPFSNKTKEK